jgi:hypothetical protein
MLEYTLPLIYGFQYFFIMVPWSFWVETHLVLSKTCVLAFTSHKAPEYALC